MRKTFVLDTNVVLHEPRAAFRFGDNDVVLPIYVVEELDQFKKDLSELGRNAREFSRTLDDLRGRGSIKDGVPLESGGTLRVAFLSEKRPHDSAFTSRHQYDNHILACALELKERDPRVEEGRVILVTKDANLRIRADALGLEAEDYDAAQIEISELYPGHRELDVEQAQLQLAAFTADSAFAGVNRWGCGCQTAAACQTERQADADPESTKAFWHPLTQGFPMVPKGANKRVIENDSHLR